MKNLLFFFLRGENWSAQEKSGKIKKKKIETATNTIAKTTNFVSFVMKKIHAKL